MSWTVDKKLAFVHKMTKEALSSIPHYDAGGPVSGPTTLNTNGVNTNQSGPSSITSPVTNTYENLGYGAIPGVTSALNGISNAFTNNFQGQAAPIQQGTNAGQLNAAYSGAQTGLNNQAGLVSQTQPGVAQGLGAQGVLSGQLAAQASGQGPNPAQAALNQSTGQNIAQQAALAAGQRGAGANAGLIASQNAQQGAATQQQAVGQSATLQAQQQLAAQQEQAALAAQQVGQGATAVQNQNQQQQNEQNILQGANTSANNAAVSQQSNINNVNSQTAASNQNEANTVFGGITAGISSLFADGGYVSDTPAFQPTASDVSSGPSVPATSTLPVSSSGSSGGSGGGGAGAGGCSCQWWTSWPTECCWTILKSRQITTDAHGCTANANESSTRNGKWWKSDENASANAWEK